MNIYVIRLEMWISMLSSLACKCVFYRPEHNAQEGTHGIKFWRSSDPKRNIVTDRSQRADQKMGKWVPLSDYVYL